MNWIYENPMTILLVGIVLTTVLGGSWLQTGRRGLLIGAGVVVAITVILLFVERSVQTDSEQVQATIYQIAKDVEGGDLPTLLNHIHPIAATVRTQASSEFPLYKIKQVTVKSGMKVQVRLDHQPPQAIAEFNVAVDGSDAANVLGEHHVPRFAIVTLLKDGDAWKISAYEHHEPTHGMRSPSDGSR